MSVWDKKQPAGVWVLSRREQPGYLVCVLCVTKDICCLGVALCIMYVVMCNLECVLMCGVIFFLFMLQHIVQTTQGSSKKITLSNMLSNINFATALGLEKITVLQSQLER